MFTRKSVALFVLAALAAGVAVDVLRDEGAGPPERHASPAAPAARSAAGRHDLVGSPKRERLAGELIGDPFAGREAVRQAAAAPAAPPAVAPPFPYRYAGQFRIDDGGWRVYLLKGTELVAIKVGDMLEGSFKVMAIGTEELEVLHVPSAETLVISYADLGTGSSLAQGAGTPQVLPGAAGSSSAGSHAARQAPEAGSPVGTGSQSAAIVGGAALAGARPALGTAATAGTSASVRTGAVPTGQLGTAGPSAGAPRLGVAPAASSSMPMSPAPAGVMQTLPAPSGRLGM